MQQMSSYETHDGHELDLMLAGNKPLAFFYEEVGADSIELMEDYEEFERRVHRGEFLRGEFTIESVVGPRNGRSAKIRYVFYSTKDEGWRIPAMILVLKTMLITRRRPDEGLDRMVGSLLGYTDAQNEEFILKDSIARKSRLSGNARHA